MNWEDLRHFLALARTGSLSEAARHLGVDHTTVARRVSALETAFGLRLVDRLPRAYVLTADGRRIADAGERLEEQAFAVLRAAHGADPAMSGTVRLSAPPTFASAFLAPRLAGLRTRHPGIVIDLVGDSRTAALERREADLAIRLMPPAGEGLVARRLAEMAFGLYAAPGYTEHIAEADWTFVAYDDQLEHVPQQQWGRRVAGDRPVVFCANDLAIIAAAARAGVGIAVLPHFLADGDSGLAPVPAPVDAPPPPRRGLWLVVQEDMRRAPRIRAVMDFVAEVVGADARRLDGGIPPDGSPLSSGSSKLVACPR